MNKDKYYDNDTWRGTYLVLPFRVFQNMQECEQTFGDLRHFIEQYVELRRTFCGVVSNSNVRLEYRRHMFAFGVYASKQANFQIWNDTGNVHIAELPRPDNDIPDDLWIAQLKSRLDEFLEGYMRCSDCGKKIAQNQIAGRYYAGSYCSDCWNRAWKEIAARDTYD